MRIMKFISVLLGIMAVGIVNAMQAPNVSYSADSYMESAEGVTQGKVYVANDLERREFNQDGQSMVMILRRDKKLVWMLMPDDQMYMEVKIPKEGRADDLGNYKIDTTTIGPETVNGVETTKSKVIMTGPDNTKMGGFWWATREGIIVKMDAIAVDKNKKERFKIDLKNLEIGEQDPAMFEVPDTYTKLDMGGIGSMMLGGDDDDEDKNPDDNKPPAEEKKKGFSWKDAIDILK